MVPSLSKGCKGSTTYAVRLQMSEPAPRSSGIIWYSDSLVDELEDDQLDEELPKHHVPYVDHRTTVGKSAMLC